MACASFCLIWWHCMQWFTPPLDPILPSAGVGEGCLFPCCRYLAHLLETYLSAASSLCVCEGRKLQKWKMQRKATQLLWPCVWAPAKSISHDGIIANSVPTIWYLYAKAKVTSSVHFCCIFQINFFKKGAEMFSKRMDSFLSSVSDMVQR